MATPSTGHEHAVAGHRGAARAGSGRHHGRQHFCSAQPESQQELPPKRTRNCGFTLTPAAGASVVDLDRCEAPRRLLVRLGLDQAARDEQAACAGHTRGCSEPRLIHRHELTVDAQRHRRAGLRPGRVNLSIAQRFTLRRACPTRMSVEGLSRSTKRFLERCKIT